MVNLALSNVHCVFRTAKLKSRKDPYFNVLKFIFQMGYPLLIVAQANIQTPQSALFFWEFSHYLNFCFKIIQLTFLLDPFLAKINIIFQDLARNLKCQFILKTLNHQRHAIKITNAIITDQISSAHKSVIFYFTVVLQIIISEMINYFFEASIEQKIFLIVSN